MSNFSHPLLSFQKSLTMSRILVVGATGRQGGAVLRALQHASKGHPDPHRRLFALTRNPSSPAAKKLASEGVQVIQGDINDTAGLTSTLKQVDRAFLVTDISQGTTKEEQAGKNFVAAAKAAGLEHLVFSSVDGAERDSKVPHFESKFQIETALRLSGLSHTVIRPVAFMDMLPIEPGFLRFIALGIFRAALGGKPIQLVATKDIGFVAACALLEPNEYKGQSIGLAGDELTISQMASALSKSNPAWVAWIPRFMIALFPYDMKQMFKFFGERGYNVDIPALKAQYPTLSTFEDYISSRE
ncbi:NAD(P)-binding protein [Flagelloscypha sp. PMI_526]|nr:NAD(P)-binding protein [Flagelloscypha sp. PMI_526]